MADFSFVLSFSRASGLQGLGFREGLFPNPQEESWVGEDGLRI